ncbi:lysozyme inhibitor LprI family protein [Metabacillus halosaccharovorans]|uniref:lysozyme inhibitor LprI family protein n=1 Tax=Metabacillus halosaccharovorans TaxID=930124 RepID=UPI000995DCDC|nr:lysozyme inhibitor LprI family protein [Metabacillus halosaccharovorans]
MNKLFAALSLLVFLVACNNEANVDNSEDIANEEEEEVLEENDTETSVDTKPTVETDSKEETEQPADRKAEEENESNETKKGQENKQIYVEKLKSIEKEVTEIRNNDDDTTIGMTKSEEVILDKWDQVLNEIYQVLEKQLSSNEMEKLRQEQRKWVTYRDETAKKDASQFEGGTMESLEYVASLANTTKERCYELVEKFMK